MLLTRLGGNDGDATGSSVVEGWEATMIAWLEGKKRSLGWEGTLTVITRLEGWGPARGHKARKEMIARLGRNVEGCSWR